MYILSPYVYHRAVSFWCFSIVVSICRAGDSFGLRCETGFEIHGWGIGGVWVKGLDTDV